MKKILLIVSVCGLITGGGIWATRVGLFDLSVNQLIAKYERPQSKYLDVDGLRIHYQDEGVGPALLLFHGSFMNLRAWDQVVEKLKHQYRLIRMDQPGVGLSGGTANHDTASLTIHEIAHRLLLKLNLKGVTCVGTSSGSTVCTNLIAAYPDLVTQLVVSNAPSEVVKVPRSERPLSVRIQMLISDDILQFRTLWFWQVYYSYLWGTKSQPTDQLLREYYDFNRRVRALLPLSLYVSNYDVRTKASSKGVSEVSENRYYNGSKASMRAMAAVDLPTLIIWGLSDPILPPTKLDQFIQSMPNAIIKVRTLSAVGHYPVLEVPDQFANFINDFLSEQ